MVTHQLPVGGNGKVNRGKLNTNKSETQVSSSVRHKTYAHTPHTRKEGYATRTLSPSAGQPGLIIRPSPGTRDRVPFSLFTVSPSNGIDVFRR